MPISSRKYSVAASKVKLMEDVEIVVLNLQPCLSEKVTNHLL